MSATPAVVDEAADEQPVRRRMLVADYPATRTGIRIALRGEAEICAEADDAEQAIRAAKREQPDVALVARQLPGGGLHAVRGISRAAPDATIVVLAQVEDVDDLLDCIRAGAIGYVPAPIDAAHLRRIISAVHANEAVVPRSMVRDLVLELRGGSAEDGALTNRERQVLRLLRRGQNTGAIAQRLGIAPVTVRRHISDIVRKLGFEDRETLASGGQS